MDTPRNTALKATFTTCVKTMLFLLVTTLVVSTPYAVPGMWASFFSRSLARENVGVFIASPVENQRWYVIMLAPLFLILSALVLRNPVKLSRNWSIAGAALLWFGYTFIRYALLPWPTGNLQDIYLQVAFVMIFSAALLTSPTSRNMLVLFIGVSLFSIPLCLLALLQAVGIDPLPYNQWTADGSQQLSGKLIIASTFGHPNYLGSYLASAAVMSLGLAYLKSRKALSMLGILTLVVIFSTLLISGTRAALLSVMVGMFAFFALRRGTLLRSSQKRLMLYVCLAAIAIAAIYYARPEAHNPLTRLLGGKEVASRVFYWKTGLEMFRANPVFGIGPGQFDSQFWEAVASSPENQPGERWHFILGAVVRGVRPGYMHNDHLQILVETGLIGSLLWACFLCGLFSVAIGNRKRLTSETAVTINAITGAVAATMTSDALFGFPLFLPCSGLMFWALTGLWISWQRSRHNNTTP